MINIDVHGCTQKYLESYPLKCEQYANHFTPTRLATIKTTGNNKGVATAKSRRFLGRMPSNSL